MHSHSSYQDCLDNFDVYNIQVNLLKGNRMIQSKAFSLDGSSE